MKRQYTITEVQKKRLRKKKCQKERTELNKHLDHSSTDGKGKPAQGGDGFSLKNGHLLWSSIPPIDRRCILGVDRGGTPRGPRRYAVSWWHQLNQMTSLRTSLCQPGWVVDVQLDISSAPAAAPPCPTAPCDPLLTRKRCPFSPERSDLIMSTISCTKRTISTTHIHTCK